MIFKILVSSCLNWPTPAMVLFLQRFEHAVVSWQVSQEGNGSMQHTTDIARVTPLNAGLLKNIECYAVYVLVLLIAWSGIVEGPPALVDSLVSLLSRCQRYPRWYFWCSKVLRRFSIISLYLIWGMNKQFLEECERRLLLLIKVLIVCSQINRV
jgi:hypothetical protein